MLSFNQSVINLHIKYGFKIVGTKKTFLNRFEKKHDLINLHLVKNLENSEKMFIKD